MLPFQASKNNCRLEKWKRYLDKDFGIIEI